MILFDTFLYCFLDFPPSVSLSFFQVMACRCKGMSSAACCTPRARCVPKMCCGLRCRRRDPTAVYKLSCKYSKYYPLLELECSQRSAGMENMPAVRGGCVIIYPGHVVMARLGAVIAREVRNETGRNITSHLKISFEPVEPCRSHSVNTAGIS